MKKRKMNKDLEAANNKCKEASLILQFFLLIYVSYSSLVALRSRRITSPQPILVYVRYVRLYISIYIYIYKLHNPHRHRHIHNILFAHILLLYAMFYIVWNNASTQQLIVCAAFNIYEIQFTHTYPIHGTFIGIYL